MAITTPLMDEILQHFARVFPMPGRIDGREDYLALVNAWVEQLEPYSDEQVKVACRRLMGKLKRFPYPSDVRDQLAAASATSTAVVSLSVELDTSSIAAALAKMGELRAAFEELGKVDFPHAGNSVMSELIEEVRYLRAQIDRAVKPAPFLAPRYAARPE